MEWGERDGVLKCEEVKDTDVMREGWMCREVGGAGVRCDGERWEAVDNIIVDGNVHAWEVLVEVHGHVWPDEVQGFEEARAGTSERSDAKVFNGCEETEDGTCGIVVS